jgi:hypothetical protein
MYRQRGDYTTDRSLEPPIFMPQETQSENQVIDAMFNELHEVIDRAEGNLKSIKLLKVTAKVREIIEKLEKS